MMPKLIENPKGGHPVAVAGYSFRGATFVTSYIKQFQGAKMSLFSYIIGI